jgi:hypothetical protein
MREYLIIKTEKHENSPEIKTLKVHSRETNRTLAYLKLKILGSDYHMIER